MIPYDYIIYYIYLQYIIYLYKILMIIYFHFIHHFEFAFFIYCAMVFEKEEKNLSQGDCMIY